MNYSILFITFSSLNSSGIIHCKFSLWGMFLTIFFKPKMLHKLRIKNIWIHRFFLTISSSLWSRTGASRWLSVEDLSQGNLMILTIVVNFVNILMFFDTEEHKKYLNLSPSACSFIDIMFPMISEATVTENRIFAMQCKSSKVTSVCGLERVSVFKSRHSMAFWTKSSWEDVCIWS